MYTGQAVQREEGEQLIQAWWGDPRCWAEALAIRRKLETGRVAKSDHGRERGAKWLLRQKSKNNIKGSKETTSVPFSTNRGMREEFKNKPRSKYVCVTNMNTSPSLQTSRERPTTWALGRMTQCSSPAHPAVEWRYVSQSQPSAQLG